MNPIAHAQWLDEGLITFRFDETNGVENTLSVHKDVHGRQYRKSIVKV